jgi:hypothetical protein
VLAALLPAELGLGRQHVAFGPIGIEILQQDPLYGCVMVPNAVTIVPLNTILKEGHLLNTYWALFLPYVLGPPYTIFLMRQYFRNIP